MCDGSIKIDGIDKLYIEVEQDDVISQYEIALNNIEDDIPINVIIDTQAYHAGEAEIVLTCPTGGGYRYVLPYVIENKGDTADNLYVNEIKQDSELYIIIYAPLSEIHGTVATRIQ